MQKRSQASSWQSCFAFWKCRNCSSAGWLSWQTWRMFSSSLSGKMLWQFLQRCQRQSGLSISIDSAFSPLPYFPMSEAIPSSILRVTYITAHPSAYQEHLLCEFLNYLSVSFVLLLYITNLLWGASFCKDWIYLNSLCLNQYNIIVVTQVCTYLLKKLAHWSGLWLPSN